MPSNIGAQRQRT
uniref:Uncharacterized protein n=1 Tax=Rhizophora mucronata TaxID=61149 RepID=A0A2P2NC45_RHIMU